jgi:hypothetical protein
MTVDAAGAGQAATRSRQPTRQKRSSQLIKQKIGFAQPGGRQYIAIK